MPVARRGEGLRVLDAGPAQPDDDLIRARACRRLARDGRRRRLRDGDRRGRGWGLRLDDGMRDCRGCRLMGGEAPGPCQGQDRDRRRADGDYGALMGWSAFPSSGDCQGMREIGPNVDDHQDLWISGARNRSHGRPQAPWG